MTSDSRLASALAVATVGLARLPTGSAQRREPQPCDTAPRKAPAYRTAPSTPAVARPVWRAEPAQKGELFVQSRFLTPATAPLVIVPDSKTKKGTGAHIG